MTAKAKSRVMLAMLNISVWCARTFDGKATKEVTDNHNPQSDIGRFNKRLLPENARSYEAVVGTAAEARKALYRSTLQYGQDGVRLLPADAYMDLAAEIRGFKTEFYRRVDTFLEDVDNLKRDARVMLNGLFRESDYPLADELRKKFGFRFKVLPFPDADQFGIELPESDLIEIRTAIDQHASEAIQSATRDLAERLYGAVARMTERLSSPKPVIRDTLVENVKEIVEILPRLNFTGDPELARFCEQAQARLVTQSAEDLRTSAGARMTAAKEAADIQAQMAAYMGIALPEDFGKFNNNRVPEGALM